MPSEVKALLQAQSEKPLHYTYLKEFRVEQCHLFLQHKCTQHRPYTCFHWHFMNQRRRRPIRRREGTFNYSPDVYCTKYDETTGLCEDGDECPYLHRVAGDTERRYHLRYYKTGMCVHDTDARGFCVKNGHHCAFAHGIQDLRPPVYDIRELHLMEGPDGDGHNGFGPNNLDKERNMMNDDPKWQDSNYVLVNYKTEPCKRPPRLCRQGYACPQYHNNRDKRRSPKKHKYRSTPCPNVKASDEWGDPAQCENGDNCGYCHTRTEQQFHPEIYKSTKCNDMQQNGYCPRGAFCAFAHVDHEIAGPREISTVPECGTSLADILSSALPPCREGEASAEAGVVLSSAFTDGLGHHAEGGLFGRAERSHSLSLGEDIDLSAPLPSYPRAPGSEREDKEASLRRHFSGNDQAGGMHPRFSSLFLGSQSSSAPSTGPNFPLGSFSFPSRDTLDCVLGNALDDLHIDDPLFLGATSLEKELSLDASDVPSINHSRLLGESSTAPVNIPRARMGSGGDHRGGLLGSFSPTSSPLVSNAPPGFLPQSQGNPIEHQASGGGLLGASHSSNMVNSMHGFGSLPSSNLFGDQGMMMGSPIARGGIAGSLPAVLEVQRLREELRANRAKLASWEEGIAQARTACDAWRREAEEANQKARQAQQEKNEAMQQLNLLHQSGKSGNGSGTGSVISVGIPPGTSLDTLPLPTLRSLRMQIACDLESIEQLIHQKQTKLCVSCEELPRSAEVILLCGHMAFCNKCAKASHECPLCKN
ncbi:unnamed protein product [Darwinula stevensoni]|uniref:Uncharacterized protein n=1 Tax=Darwinula stevensoni TaxID=69355 RepID=A0A7R9A5X3_9CRUS|nr:unnamed protein product [Darwinula stevensoni]CAG0886231.1 unnamed protein product [Darwinula stevensoni]